MARVSIDSGPVDPTDSFASTPRDKWKLLVWEKRDFLSTRLNYDCRCLVEFCQEANTVWQELGYESAADMVRNGYELDPQEIEIAVAWLKINEPDTAIGIGDIKAKVEAARKKPLADVGPPTKEERGNVCNANIAKGGTVDYTLRRLARDNPEMLNRIESGELSVNAAAIAAGIRKKATPAEVCVKAFYKTDDRLSVVSEIVKSLASHERAWLIDLLSQLKEPTQ
jgi:hypothetical protein